MISIFKKLFCQHDYIEIDVIQNEKYFWKKYKCKKCKKISLIKWSKKLLDKNKI